MRWQRVRPLVWNMTQLFISFFANINLLRFWFVYIRNTTASLDSFRRLSLCVLYHMLHVVLRLKVTLLHHRWTILVDGRILPVQVKKIYLSWVIFDCWIISIQTVVQSRNLLWFHRPLWPLFVLLNFKYLFRTCVLSNFGWFYRCTRFISVLFPPASI